MKRSYGAEIIKKAAMADDYYPSDEELAKTKAEIEKYEKEIKEEDDKFNAGLMTPEELANRAKEQKSAEEARIWAQKEFNKRPKKEFGLMEKAKGEDQYHITAFQFDTTEEALKTIKWLKEKFPTTLFRILHRPKSPLTYEQLMRNPIHEDVKNIKAKENKMKRISKREATAGPTLGQPYFDFSAHQLKAEGMSDAELQGAIKDIKVTLELLAQESRNGFDVSKREGWYADELATYAKELDTRAANIFVPAKKDYPGDYKNLVIERDSRRDYRKEIKKTAANKPGKGHGKIEEKTTSDGGSHYVWSYTFENPSENGGHPVTSQRIHRSIEGAQIALDHFIQTGIVNKADGSTYHYEAPQALIGQNFKPITHDELRAQMPAVVNAPLVRGQKIPYEVWVKSKKSDGTTYEKWEKRLDKLISKQYGLGMADFPDWRSMDTYESNKTVEQGFSAFKSAQKKLGGFE
jgi:hypothetical protein